MSSVSIVLPAFNAQAYLRQAVASVRAQSHQEWNLWIAIDPATRDATRALAEHESARDSRVHVLTASEPGAAAARNSALRLVPSRYVAFLDCDDLWLPAKLNHQLHVMKRMAAGISCTAFRRMDLSGRVGRKISVPKIVRYERLRQQNCMLCSSVMVDRERAGDLSFRDCGCEDFALWLDLLRKGVECVGIGVDLVRYRVSPNSRGANKWRTLRESWEILRSQENLPAWRATGVMLPFLTRNAIKHAIF